MRVVVDGVSKTFADRRVANGFMKQPLALKAIVDTSFLEEAVKAWTGSHLPEGWF